MPTFTGYQRLVEWGRALPPLVVDAVIAIGCYLTIVVMAYADGRTSWWVFALAAANVLPLLWRRRFPFTVTLITGVFTTWLSLVGAISGIPAAQLVATYTFAALCPPILRLLAVLGTVLGITVSLVPHDEFLAFGPVGIMFAVAYTLGTSARARRDRIAMLEERARRLAEEQEVAATRERERIAREVHDVLAHSMSLVVVQAEAGPVAVRSDPGKAEEVFDTISSTAREALGQYRIVQESLTNTVKHAAASQAWVRLEWRDGALRLEVRDDGRGPAPGGARGGHGWRAGCSAGRC